MKKVLCTLLIMTLLMVCTVCIVARAEEKDEKWYPLGEFKITHYCSCKKCCGKWGNITSSGTKPTRYRTVSVDPDVIPIGTVLYIDTYGYRIAEDTGSGVTDRHIDVYTDTHQHALQLGVQKHKVWIVEGRKKW